MKLLHTLQQLKNSETYQYLLNNHHRDILDTFISDYNFSVHTNPIRIIIPYIDENYKYFTIDGIKKFVDRISLEYPMELKKELKNTEGILLVYPVLKGQNPYLGIVFIFHQLLENTFQVIQCGVKKIKETMLDVSFDSDKNILNLLSTDYYSLDEVLGYEDYFDFVSRCKEINPSINKKDLGFLIIGGSFPLIFDGERWFSNELENKKIMIP